MQTGQDSDANGPATAAAKCSGMAGTIGTAALVRMLVLADLRLQTGHYRPMP